MHINVCSRSVMEHIEKFRWIEHATYVICMYEMVPLVRRLKITGKQQWTQEVCAVLLGAEVQNASNDGEPILTMVRRVHLVAGNGRSSSLKLGCIQAIPLMVCSRGQQQLICSLAEERAGGPGVRQVGHPAVWGSLPLYTITKWLLWVYNGLYIYIPKILMDDRSLG